MSTVSDASPRGEVHRAAARLTRERLAGRSGYDDLGAPGWDAFLESRRRYLTARRAERAVRSHPPANGGSP
jgi:hypothetical protein